jgi:aryl-alcohol dehydrogenase-like predicted oxidoreductase
MRALVPRPLGRTGLSVSPLGLAGSHGLGADAVERAFHELGVRYFHVGDAGPGFKEGVRRLVRAGHRDRMVIAGGAVVPTGRGVRRAWERAAGELGIDRFDVWILYWVRARLYVTGRTWPAMRRLQAEGKTRALAISCHDRPLAWRLHRELDLDVLMLRYNAAHRGAEEQIFGRLPAGPRPGVVVYTVTRWGRLLRPAGGQPGLSGPDCYRFALSRPEVDVALTSPASWEELAANAAGAGAGPLDEPALAQARRFGDAVRMSAAGRLSFFGR